MAQYHITLNDELLHGLFTRDEGLAKLLEQVLNQILEAQVEEQLGARRYERTEERKGYRNGSYPRQLTTRVGRLTLRWRRFEGFFMPQTSRQPGCYWNKCWPRGNLFEPGKMIPLSANAEGQDNDLNEKFNSKQ
nr:transposase [Parageobacillus thermoglucosidasius]